MRRLALAVLCLQAVLSLGQQISNERLSNDRLSNDQFNLTYSSAGLSSIKHTHDSYDTDYITPGRTLGDVVVRYRSAGDNAWQEVSSGNSAVAASERLSYTVGRAVPTIATSSRPSSSSGQWSLEALSDQIEPSNAGRPTSPSFVGTITEEPANGCSTTSTVPNRFLRLRRTGRKERKATRNGVCRSRGSCSIETGMSGRTFGPRTPTRSSRAGSIALRSKQ